MKKTLKLKQINIKKEDVMDRVRSAVDGAKDFVSDHSEGILYTIVYGGSAIIFGQSIHYMHLLNKAAKRGQFFR